MKVPLPQVREGRVLADWVTASLREAILNGYFEPGEKLDQDGIAEELEVSRTPVREAVRRLESEGFIKVRPHHGAFIAKVSRRDIRKVYEIRRLFEAEVVRQVTPLIPESVFGELDRSLTETQAQFEAGDIAKQFESDVCFHDTIANFVENKLLKEGNRPLGILSLNDYQFITVYKPRKCHCKPERSGGGKSGNRQGGDNCEPEMKSRSMAICKSPEVLR